jgi:NADH-quinone oxidoreductase subunit N
MNLALFYVIYSLAPAGENVTLEHLKGLHKRAPLLAFTLAAGAFGLAGIPPMPGFMGKFYVLTAALAKGHLALVVVAALNTAIAIFYYLKMVRAAYSSEGEEPDAEPVRLSLMGRALGYAFIVVILAVGVFPGALLQLFHDALAWVA